MRRGTVELGYSLEKTERKRAIEKRKFQALNFQKMGILFITKDVPRHPNGGEIIIIIIIIMRGLAMHGISLSKACTSHFTKMTAKTHLVR